MALVAARYKVHEHGLRTRSARAMHVRTISVVGVANSAARLRMRRGKRHSNAYTAKNPRLCNRMCVPHYVTSPYTSLWHCCAIHTCYRAVSRLWYSIVNFILVTRLKLTSCNNLYNTFMSQCCIHFCYIHGKLNVVTKLCAHVCHNHNTTSIP